MSRFKLRLAACLGIIGVTACQSMDPSGSTLSSVHGRADWHRIARAHADALMDKLQPNARGVYKMVLPPHASPFERSYSAKLGDALANQGVRVVEPDTAFDGNPYLIEVNAKPVDRDAGRSRLVVRLSVIDGRAQTAGLTRTYRLQDDSFSSYRSGLPSLPIQEGV